jgi:mono/diheme cytochrome c family protein
MKRTMQLRQTLRIRTLALTLTGALGLNGCYYDIEEELYPGSGTCDTTGATYTGKVEPIIRRSCYSCHGTGIGLGGITLEGANNLKTYANNGQLMGSIEHRSGYSPMPKSAPRLSDCEIRTVQAWINAGQP